MSDVDRLGPVYACQESMRCMTHFAALPTIAVLIAGDADFVPIVEEVKRRGVMVTVAASASSLADALRRVAEPSCSDHSRIKAVALTADHSYRSPLDRAPTTLGPAARKRFSAAAQREASTDETGSCETRDPLDT